MLKPISMLLLAATSAMAQTYTVTLPDSICQTGNAVTWEKRITAYCEGPAYEASTGYVYFTEQSGGANWPIWRIRPQTADTGLRWVNQYQSNGLEFDPQGRLVAVQNGRLTRYTSAGTLDSTLVLSGQNGVTFNQANDLSIGNNGAVYFTDLGANVFFLSTARTLSVVTNGQQSANGIEWIEERNTVYVNNAGGGLTRRFTAPAAGGALTAPVTFATPVGTPDGATFDSHGNYYTASYSTGNVVVFNAAGVQLGTIALRFATGAYDGRAGAQGNASNCAFGGPNNTILYMTGDGGLYSLQMRIPGRLRPGTPIHDFSIQAIRKSETGFGRFDLRGRHFGIPSRKIPTLTFAY